MANLIQWGRPSMLSLQRDVEDMLGDFPAPRGFRREMSRLFDEFTSPRPLWREMDRLFDEFDSPTTMRQRVARLFEDVVGPTTRALTQSRETFMPALELTEHENEFVMKADLPGIREQDIDLRIDDSNLLTVSGERRDDVSKRAPGYEYSERSYGAFSRSVSLPAGTDTSRINADFRNGVLEIHIPKSPEARTRKIAVTREEPRILAPTNGPVIQAQKSQARSS